jgi:hypothetical protein
MSDTEKPKLLDHELESKRKLFFRYFHAYKKAYHETLWQLEEVSLLINNLEHSNHNMWMLNEALYKYAESSISALYWLRGDVKDHPFVHQFLREWRNDYHHQAKVDYQLYDFSFHLDEEKHSYSDDYFVIPMVSSSGRMKKLLKKWFGSERIATDATVSGLVVHHHGYMLEVFQGYERDMQRDMPEKYLIHNSQQKGSFGGAKYEQFFPESEFWSFNK